MSASKSISPYTEIYRKAKFVVCREHEFVLFTSPIFGNFCTSREMWKLAPGTFKKYFDATCRAAMADLVHRILKKKIPNFIFDLERHNSRFGCDTRTPRGGFRPLLAKSTTPKNTSYQHQLSIVVSLGVAEGTISLALFNFTPGIVIVTKSYSFGLFFFVTGVRDSNRAYKRLECSLPRRRSFAAWSNASSASKKRVPLLRKME